MIREITELVEKDVYIESLEQILNSINEGIVATDGEGKIFIFNQASEKLEGLKAEQVLGKTLWEVYGIENQTSIHFKARRQNKPLLGVCENFLASGKVITLITDNFPLYDGDKVIGAFSVSRDMTKIRELMTRALSAQKHHVYLTLNMVPEEKKDMFHTIVGHSPALLKEINKARKAAENDCSVLVVGETGTGKELFVQSIYKMSARSKEPFIPINCAALPESLLESLLFGTVKGAFTGALDTKGLFEQAGNGVLFLDELNSMSLNMQAKILRVLQEKTIRRLGDRMEIPVNCRVISTTNEDPLVCIENSTLRQDLFYRLAVILIYIPPLRDRKEDIEALCQAFVKECNKKYGLNIAGISPELLDIFMKYHWPGNIRELQNLIESAANLIEGDERRIKPEHMPYYFYNLFHSTKVMMRDALSERESALPELMKELEAKTIMDALSKYRGNVSQAAAYLGMPRQNLNYKIKKLAIDLDKIRDKD
ncbi:hypothetical protein DCMF_10690 [Candidatus Formimonas warabiya]|uniref:PAS domain S-box protein n=1 Tax=Formimonas warabiya TaxID=1761012 RepID=A0A3G1L1L6_FORW1|nr:hypothetical protein DCMF_10690 [Candidatus Formimonas warabiya]